MCNIYETRLILSSFERWSKEAEAQFLNASMTEGINLGIGLFEAETGIYKTYRLTTLHNELLLELQL